MRSTTISARRRAPLSVWIAWLLIGVSTRVSIASIPPLIQQIQDALAVDQHAGALLTAAPVLFMGALPLVVSAAMGQRRWNTVVQFALALIAVATALRFASPSYAVLLLTCALVGVGTAVCQTLLPAVTARAWPHQTAALTAVFASGMGVGAAAAAAASPLLYVAAASWGVALGVWVSMPLLAEATLHLVAAAEPNPKPLRAAPTVKTPIGALLRICAYFVGSATLFWTSLAWLAPAYRAMGRGDEEAGLLMAVFTLAQIPGSLVADSLWNVWRFRVLDGLLGVTALSLVAMPTASQQALAWLWVAIAGFGCGGLFSLGMYLPAWLGRDGAEIRRMSALSLTFGYVLAGLGPLAFAWLREHSASFLVPFACLAAVCVPMCLISHSIERNPMHG
jgi:CP family cyanate transporter-like MFS transporter